MSAESEIKKQITDFLDVLPGCAYRVVQLSGIRGRRNAARGMSDIVAVYKQKAVFIEVKKPGGVISPDQIKFLDDMKSAGAICIVAYSLKEAIDGLKGVA